MQAPITIALLLFTVVPTGMGAGSPQNVGSLPSISGDISWYDPPAAYGVSWAVIIGNFEGWGRLHGLTYNPAHPYCAMRDFPVGSLVEILWQGKAATCYVVDYGPDAAVFPERVLDASVEIFEALAPRSRGVLHGATVRLLNTDHCGPAPVKAPAKRSPVTFPRGGWGRMLCWPI